MVAMSVAMISCGGGNNSNTQESTSNSQEQPAKNNQNQNPKLQGLPQPIIDYVQQHYPNASVDYIDTDQEKEGMFYEIRFKDGTEIVFDPNFQVRRTSDPSRE